MNIRGLITANTMTHAQGEDELLVRPRGRSPRVLVMVGRSDDRSLIST